MAVQRRAHAIPMALTWIGPLMSNEPARGGRGTHPGVRPREVPVRLGASPGDGGGGDHLSRRRSTRSSAENAGAPRDVERERPLCLMRDTRPLQALRIGHEGLQVFASTASTGTGTHKAGARQCPTSHGEWVSGQGQLTGHHGADVGRAPPEGADEGGALLRLLTSAREVSMTHQTGPDGMCSGCWSCWDRLVSHPCTQAE